MLESDPEFEQKRQTEYKFFLSVLKDFGDQGLRPHQALAVLNDIIERGRGKKDEDKFYWEGVFGPKFTSDPPDWLPKQYIWSTLNEDQETNERNPRQEA